MIDKNKTIREIIESEEPEFNNAWEHALYHLTIGTCVLFEEFEGRDHNKLYSKLTKIVNKIQEEYDTYKETPTLITKEQYIELKKLFIEDPNAMKYEFPIRVISTNGDGPMVNIHKYRRKPALYLREKLPWLNDI